MAGSSVCEGARRSVRGAVVSSTCSAARTLLRAPRRARARRASCRPCRARTMSVRPSPSSSSDARAVLGNRLAARVEIGPAEAVLRRARCPPASLANSVASCARSRSTASARIRRESASMTVLSACVPRGARLTALLSPSCAVAVVAPRSRTRSRRPRAAAPVRRAGVEPCDRRARRPRPSPRRSPSTR